MIISKTRIILLIIIIVHNLLLPEQSHANDSDHVRLNHTALSFDSSINHFSWMENILFVDTKEALFWFDRDGVLIGNFCHESKIVLLPIYSGIKGFFAFQFGERQYRDLTFNKSLIGLELLEFNWNGQECSKIQIDERIIRNWAVSDDGVLFLCIGTKIKDARKADYEELRSIDKLVAIDLDRFCTLWSFQFEGGPLVSAIRLLKGTHLALVAEKQILLISLEGKLKWKQPFYDWIIDFEDKYPNKPSMGVLAESPFLAGPGKIGDNYWIIVNLDVLVLLDSDGRLQGMYQSPEAYFLNGYGLYNKFLVLDHFSGDGILSLFSLEEQKLESIPYPKIFLNQRNKAIKLCGVIGDNLIFFKFNSLSGKDTANGRQWCTKIYSWRVGVEAEPLELGRYCGMDRPIEVNLNEADSLLAIKHGLSVINILNLENSINQDQ